MLDFTSSLYLGMRHESASLGGWTHLTTGVPPALRALSGTGAVEERIAALQGCERAVLFPSTLHAFWDLCDALCEERVAIFVDAGTYHVAARGVERARLRGVTVQSFSHHDSGALARRIASGARGERPVVVTDGFCPACGRAAPIASYLAEVRRGHGLLVVDDTQALGIFGTAVPGLPYGFSGGGILQHLGITGGDVVVVASLAKAFGAPVAALSGARGVVGAFARSSTTRIHSSGVSALSLRAAEHALDENDARGDTLRWRLFQNVRRFRAALPWSASGGCFPVQAPPEMTVEAAVRVQGDLKREGVRAVLLRGGCGGSSPLARVAFTLRATMHPSAIDVATAALSRALEPAAALARRA